MLPVELEDLYAFPSMPLGRHTLLLSFEGGLWAFGNNEHGQLGLGHKDNQRLPVEVPWKGPQLVQVDWGYAHSLVLDAEGGVWDAGRSRSSTSSVDFAKVTELPLIALVAAGQHHSVALDTEGGLWVWTSESGLSWASYPPQQVKDLPPVIKVACGFNFLVAEAEEGTLWVLGNNSSGQLGLGNQLDSHNPTLIQVAGCSRGSLRCLAAQCEGVILIDSQGKVFSAGANSFGQLGRSCGDVSKLQRISGIPLMHTASCGFVHTLSQDENGQVWAWGGGGDGQLGTGNELDLPQPTLVPSLEGISALVVGGVHSLAFSRENGLLVFGWNQYGQLGLNHVTNQSVPTLSPLLPALPHSVQSRKKSARFL